MKQDFIITPVPTKEGVQVSKAPSGQFSYMVNNVLNWYQDPLALVEEKNKLARRPSKWKEEQASNGGLKITTESEAESCSVTISSLDTIVGAGKTLPLFNYVMELVLTQAITGDELARGYVTISSRALIDKGIAKNKMDASRKLKALKSFITRLTYEGSYTPKRGKGSITWGGVLFPTWLDCSAAPISMGRGFYYIELNRSAPWGWIMRYYTFLPDFYYSLTGKAQGLCWYIFYLARQNLEAISKNQPLKISFRAALTQLHLPSQGDHLDRRAIEPLEKAADNISAAGKRGGLSIGVEMKGGQDYDLAKPSEKISDGELVINLGTYAEPFRDMRKSFEENARIRDKKAREARRARYLASKAQTEAAQPQEGEGGEKRRRGRPRKVKEGEE